MLNLNEGRFVVKVKGKSPYFFEYRSVEVETTWTLIDGLKSIMQRS